MSWDTILTCSRYFLGCVWWYLTNARSIKNVNTRIPYVGDIYVRYDYSIRGIYFKYASTEDLSINNASIRGIYTKSTYIRVLFVKSACVCQDLKVKKARLEI